LPSVPVPSGSVLRSMSTLPASAKATTSGGDMRKFALMLGWTRASKLRLPERTWRDEIALGDRLVDDRVERAGVADAGGAAVADDLEAELVEVGLQAGLVEVIGDDARAGRKRSLHRAIHGQAALDRLLREQSRREHDGGIAGVRATRDRRDEDAAVLDIDIRRGTNAVELHHGVSALRALLAKAIFSHGLVERGEELRLQVGQRDPVCGRFGPATLGETSARFSSRSEL